MSHAVHDPGMDSLSNFSYMAMAIAQILGVYTYTYIHACHHYSLRLNVSAMLCHPCASCTDAASMKTYNDKTKFYKQSYDYMYASYVHVYIRMQRVFLVSPFVHYNYLATRMCKSLHVYVASYTYGTCMLPCHTYSCVCFVHITRVSHMYVLCVTCMDYLSHG